MIIYIYSGGFKIKRKIKSTAINLFEDQIEYFKKIGENLSLFCREKIDESFETIEKIDSKIMEHSKKIEELNSRRELLKSSLKDEKESEPFFKEARLILMKNKSYLPGQIEKYKNEYGEKLTSKKFLERCKL